MLGLQIGKEMFFLVKHLTCNNDCKGKFEFAFMCSDQGKISKS